MYFKHYSQFDADVWVIAKPIEMFKAIFPNIAYKQWPFLKPRKRRLSHFQAEKKVLIMERKPVKSSCDVRFWF